MGGASHPCRENLCLSVAGRSTETPLWKRNVSKSAWGQSALRTPAPRRSKPSSANDQTPGAGSRPFSPVSGRPYSSRGVDRVGCWLRHRRWLLGEGYQPPLSSQAHMCRYALAAQRGLVLLKRAVGMADEVAGRTGPAWEPRQAPAGAVSRSDRADCIRDPERGHA